MSAGATQSSFWAREPSNETDFWKPWDPHQMLQSVNSCDPSEAIRFAWNNFLEQVQSWCISVLYPVRPGRELSVFVVTTYVGKPTNGGPAAIPRLERQPAPYALPVQLRQQKTSNQPRLSAAQTSVHPEPYSAARRPPLPCTKLWGPR